MVSALFDAAAWRPVEGFDFTDITYHRAIDLGVVRVAFDRPEVRNAFRPHTVDELYRALDHARQTSDVGCVLHTHSRAGVAVSAQKHGVLPISQQSTFVLASLAYHDYEGVALRDDEKPRLVQDLGRHTFLMLRNHGLLTVGASIADAFLAMYLFETTCAIQLRAQSGGGNLVHVDPRILATAQQQAAQVTKNLGGQLAWPGLLRKLDRIDASFRE